MGSFEKFVWEGAIALALPHCLERRGRFLTETYLDRLLRRKAEAYKAQIDTLEKLPIYQGLAEFIDKIRVAGLKMAVVSGAMRSDIELVLYRPVWQQTLS